MSSELAALDPKGSSAVISYNLPEPTSYSGRVTLGLDIPSSYYKPILAVDPPQFELAAVTRAMKNGFDNQDMFADLGVAIMDLFYVERPKVDDSRTPQFYKRTLYNENYYYKPDPKQANYVGPILRQTYKCSLYTGITGYASKQNIIDNTGKYKNIIQGGIYDIIFQTTQVPRPGDYVAVEYQQSGTYRTDGNYSHDLVTSDPPVLIDPQLSDSVLSLTPDNVLANLNAGKRLRITRDVSNNRLTAGWIPFTVSPQIGIMLRFRLSTFHGTYGAGRVIKTFSLLPGEQTTITVKSYLRTTKTRKETSSILDSFTQESSDDFSDALTKENADRKESKASLSWHVEAQAEADWGFVGVQASAGAKSGSNQAQEQFAKQMTNAVQKHASLASSKRDIKIDQSLETTLATGEETGVQRTLQNINTGRTLNFVFRQLNQEFVSILHLVDVQLAYQNGLPNGLKRYTLAEMDTMLDEIIIGGSASANGKAVKDRIVNELSYVIDYTGTPVKFLEEKPLVDGANNVVKDAQGNQVKYYRARTELTYTYPPPPSPGSPSTPPIKSFTVPGIVTAVTSNVMRTSGLIVEPLLGQGEGLDLYSMTLQAQAGRKLQLQNDLQKARNSHDSMLVNILTTQDTAAAQIYAQVYPKALPTPTK